MPKLTDDKTQAYPLRFILHTPSPRSAAPPRFPMRRFLLDAFAIVTMALAVLALLVY